MGVYKESPWSVFNPHPQASFVWVRIMLRPTRTQTGETWGQGYLYSITGCDEASTVSTWSYYRTYYCSAPVQTRPPQKFWGTTPLPAILTWTSTSAVSRPPSLQGSATSFKEDGWAVFRSRMEWRTEMSTVDWRSRDSRYVSQYYADCILWFTCFPNTMLTSSCGLHASEIRHMESRLHCTSLVGDYNS